ncbi:MAG: hypothetical protein ACT4PE_11120 [Candidatus Eiseniibacteriota bacterium]
MRIPLLPLVLVAAMMGEAEKVPIPGSERWLLRWGEAVTANDQCPVRKSRLNTKMPPVWVNGRAIGFC